MIMIYDSTSKKYIFEWQKRKRSQINIPEDMMFLYSNCSIFYNNNWQWLWFAWNSTHSLSDIWQALNQVCVCLYVLPVPYHGSQSTVFLVRLLRIYLKKKYERIHSFQFIHGNVLYSLLLLFFHSIRWAMKKSCFALECH